MTQGHKLRKTPLKNKGEIKHFAVGRTQGRRESQALSKQGRKEVIFQERKPRNFNNCKGDFFVSV